MILEHAGRRPAVAPGAWVAPDATLCGAVTVAEGARILHGARLVAERGGTLDIGRNTIVLENAVVRAPPDHPCRIGDHCLIGPNAHVVGAILEDEVFVATAAAVFHGAKLGKGSEVRVHGTVHLSSLLPAGAVVPIGWVAVGNPAHLYAPDRHEEIWAVQAPLDFPARVYGVPRGTREAMQAITGRLSAGLAAHAHDREVVPGML